MREERGHLFVAIFLLMFEVVIGTGVIGPGVGSMGAIFAGWRAAVWKDERPHLVRVAVIYAVLGISSFFVIIWNSDVAREHAAPVITAVERFQSEHGRYPEALDELTPQYLQGVPRAGFTWWSRSFRYDASRPQIYYPAMFHGIFFYDFPTHRWLAND